MCFSAGRKLSDSVNAFLQLSCFQVELLAVPRSQWLLCFEQARCAYPSLPSLHLGLSHLLAYAKCLDENRNEMHVFRLMKLVCCWGSKHKLFG